MCTIGKVIEDRKIVTVAGETTLAALAAKKPVLLVLHRFNGCLLTQYDMHVMNEIYKHLSAPRFTLAFVLQTPIEELRGDSQITALSFPVIADQLAELYQLFRVPLAADREQLLMGGASKKIEAAKALGMVHGTDTGKPLQLPAAILLKPDLRVDYACCCEHSGDLPGLEELMKNAGLK